MAKAALEARAFTTGNHVVFNRGEYDPESAEGKYLLAHELAHVRQQTGGRISMLPQEGSSLVIDPDPELEREADEVARKALEGEDPVVAHRLGMDVHVQRSAKMGRREFMFGSGQNELEEAETPSIGRTALNALNPFSGGDEEGGELVPAEVSPNPEALAEEVSQLKVNQAKLFNAVNSERSNTDVLGEAAGKGLVGGTIGLGVTALTANPVLGALAGGAMADMGKTLYGKVWGKGRDTIADIDIGTLAEKVKERLVGEDFGGDSRGLT
ncbi:eCIS core domain-containing protein [Natronobiforma cellulositropha]|uniref:eCIS core domain-containing protein n=1 Tax=Natronobiforma cellulositropha TaxID=1679076 RepID=UPI0021D5AF8F|nr:DUF4157 domain-containing protein [Natronobiforma cellulositropha]